MEDVAGCGSGGSSAGGGGGVLRLPHLKALTWMGKSHDPGADKTRTQICVQNRVTSLYLERLCPQYPRRQFGPFGVIPRYGGGGDGWRGGAATWHTHVAVIKQTNGRPPKISICRATRLAGLNISFGEREKEKNNNKKGAAQGQTAEITLALNHTGREPTPS